MLWTKDLKMNTVHVDDVCCAVWHLCLNGQKGEIYNVVDEGNTSKIICLFYPDYKPVIKECYNLEHYT